MSTPALTFCDVSCLYTPTGGGIRTYQRAKLDWFARQQRHRYVLVHPGATESELEVSPTARVITVPGMRVRGGYRLPFNLPALASIVQRLVPDVLETGDPWLGGPIGLLARQRGHTRLVSSFFHGNPIHAYVMPWAQRGRLRSLREQAWRQMDRGFFRIQRMYDVTVTSSSWIASLLADRGVRRVVRSPFGADGAFFEVGQARVRQGIPPRRRLLYAGRLQDDKGVDVLLAALPGLLEACDASLTVAGIGPRLQDFKALESDRLQLTGFVDGRAAMADLYARHDVLIAPGPYETFGLAALEGLAAGLLVVGPDEGGTHELLRQLPSPHVFASGQSGDLMATVQRVLRLDEPSLHIQAGLELAGRYGTWDGAIANGVARYCNCLSHCTT